MFEADLQDEIKKPENVITSRRLLEELKIFTLKVMIVLLTIAIVSAFAVNEIKTVIKQTKQKIELRLQGDVKDKLFEKVKPLINKFIERKEKTNEESSNNDDDGG
ncbi:hypothetical protein MCHI_001916 [Candidatus Magnetoovum chiemensis]|nr:hypothetical protein MCHI_001916 [Candidatus Magnetoovum chiemensis]